MKFTIEQSQLVAPLSKLAGIVPGPQTVSATTDFLIEPTSDSVTFTATDNNLRLSFMVEVKGEDLIPCTLPARKLLAVCSRFPSDAEIVFEHDAEQNLMRFNHKSSNYTMVTRDPEAFPSMESKEEEQRIEIPAEILMGLLAPVKYATAANDMRYYLMGVLLDVAPDKIAAAATDGHRMAVMEYPLETGIREPTQLILPNKSVEELIKCLQGDSEGDVVLRLAGNHLRAEIGGGNQVLQTILVEGKYPDYRAVVPTDREISATVNRRSFLSATERLESVSDEALKGIKLSLGERLEISCQNNVGDGGVEEFEVEYSGDPVEISMSIKYLSDALQNMQADDVVLWLKNETSSILLTSGEKTDGTHIIMPMRT